MDFEFDYELTPTKLITINDPGNAAVKCLAADNSTAYYIWTQTLMGKTSMLKFGPVIAGLAIPISGYEVTYTESKYNLKALEKDFNRFFNDFKRKIVSAEVVSSGEVLKAIPTAEAFIQY